MDERICRSCKRYAEGLDGENWLCAQKVDKWPSHLLPGFECYRRDKLLPVTKEMVEPPGICDFALEQSVVTEEMPVEENHLNRNIVYTGQEVDNRWCYGGSKSLFYGNADFGFYDKIPSIEAVDIPGCIEKIKSVLRKGKNDPS